MTTLISNSGRSGMLTLLKELLYFSLVGRRNFFVKVDYYVVSGTFTSTYDLFFTELRQA